MNTAHPYWIGFGDVHGNLRNIGRIPELAGAAGVLITGDLTIRGGVAEARRVIEAVAAHNPRILAQIGNMDHQSVNGWLEQEGRNMHTHVVELAPGLALMGVGWSTPTPFGTPSEAPDSQLGGWLWSTYQQVRGAKHLIVVSHTPPFATAADTLKPGVHVGSQALRDFIERTRPALCLTGHIHEAQSVDAIGSTVVINPGELDAGGYAHISYDGTSVKAQLKHLPGAPA